MNGPDFSKKFGFIKEALKQQPVTIGNSVVFTSDDLEYDQDFLNMYSSTNLSLFNLLLCHNFYRIIVNQSIDPDAIPNTDVQSSDDESSDDDDDDVQIVGDDFGDVQRVVTPDDNVQMINPFETPDMAEDHFNKASELIYNFCLNSRVMCAVCNVKNFNSEYYYHDLYLYYFKYLELINKK